MISGQNETVRRLAILAQFDPNGGLPAHVRIHLDRLANVATRRVLVSNSPMDAASKEIALTVCEKVVVRPNIGWDFAAWRDALYAEDMEDWDQVILTNSSVIGPISALLPIVEHMEARRHGFWGMTMSHQHTDHLQSYFLAFDKQVTHSQAWRDWWEGVEDLTDKDAIITRYELGFTRWLRNAGFTCSAFVPDLNFPQSLRLVPGRRKKGLLKRCIAWVPRNANYANRSIDFYQELIDEGMPYLKASLLWGDNTEFFKSASAVKSAAGCDYPWDEIGL